MEKSLEALVEKWGDILDAKGASPIKDRTRRETTAVLLENQNNHSNQLVQRYGAQSLTALLEGAPTNAMGASSSTAGDGAIDIYDPVMISMVRRSMPNLLAYDVCGVQPMTMPTGLIFALRSRYESQTGIEALFNEANTAFTASAKGNTFGKGQVGSDPSLIAEGNAAAYTVANGMTTAQLESLGRDANTLFNEMAMSIEKVSVTAEGRAIKAEYSHELAQDLKNVHGLDAETELANILSAEMLAEINRQIIRSIYSTATIGGKAGGVFDLDTDADGRWMVEKWKGLMFQIELEANKIAKATRMGKGNWIITSSDVASALAMAGQLDYTSGLAQERLEVDDTGNTFAGILFGRYKVFIDPYFNSTNGNNFVTVGYKGKNSFDAGLFYAPYIPLEMYRATGSEDFVPRIGFKTRYGLVAHPFATDAADGKVDATKKNKYFRIFSAKNLL
ncbi:major capsid protein [Ochrobactrum phage vB_OspM_OC]|nr:major capsid protein [Ochrobactrum phage vB_OspM_OC]